jgi:hypothetical protein
MMKTVNFLKRVRQMKCHSRLSRKTITDYGLPLLLAFYALGGFVFVTDFIPEYWNVDGTQCYENENLLRISLLVSLYVVFLWEKLRRSTATPFKNYEVGGMETALRGIVIFLIFCAITIVYWGRLGTSEPVIFGSTALFAALLILIDWAHTDWRRKNASGVLPGGEDKYEYKSKLEFLKILQSNYTWNTRACVYLFVAVGIAFSWGGAQIAVDHNDFMGQVSWGMMAAAYMSVGDLLIVMQFFRATLHSIEREILELKEPTT